MAYPAKRTLGQLRGPEIRLRAGLCRLSQYRGALWQYRLWTSTYQPFSRLVAFTQSWALVNSDTDVTCGIFNQGMNVCAPWFLLCVRIQPKDAWTVGFCIDFLAASMFHCIQSILSVSDGDQDERLQRSPTAQMQPAGRQVPAQTERRAGRAGRRQAQQRQQAEAGGNASARCLLGQWYIVAKTLQLRGSFYRPQSKASLHSPGPYPL